MTYSSTSFKFQDLPSLDLIRGSIYESGPGNSFGDDPLHKILPVGNLGGFRYTGRIGVPGLKIVALLTDPREKTWPDLFTPERRIFTYYGDNKIAGQDIHDTPKHGNKILRSIFCAYESGRGSDLPLILAFQKTGHRRDVRFEGLLVPGTCSTDPANDLTTYWDESEDSQGRFENYKANFTVLPDEPVTRQCINAFNSPLHTQEERMATVPSSLRAWCEGGWDSVDVSEPLCRPWDEP